ncbi:GLPGLI family protein [Chitinophaga pinensis]|uniref:GLPGLI family protein n=1 Tax=Chitinophaga pinensis TaxID=79329 RepID=A0A5C6LU28_9BACT|nr:GLPGLI family protein [Chitinophaga pinensis]TWW00087.1 GLPGLI family protein [Chitinophaga pinensis]
MKRLSFLLSMMVFSHVLSAQQATFVNSGKIVFERRVNTYAVTERFVKEANIIPASQVYAYMLSYRNDNPQFWTDDFELYFDSTYTLYKPQQADISARTAYIGAVSYNNKVLNNLTSHEALALKQAFDQTFFIKDTIRNIRWKLTEETREIAGFQCRRANALLSDSIYIVAYYAEEIPARGGPESFNGLPGMILGVALPHEHITIFAKRVDRQPVTPESLKLPEQGRSVPVDNKQYKKSMMDILPRFRLTSSWVQIFMDI